MLPPPMTSAEHPAMKNLASAAIAAFLLTATAHTAMAQDDDDFDPGIEDSSDFEETAPAASSDSSSDTASSAGSSDLKMGISVPLFAGLDLGALASLAGGSSSFQAARILYGLDADTWLNLTLGINFGAGPSFDDGMGGTITGDDVFGLLLGAGYRMYKPTEGKIRPYLEPGVAVQIADVGSVADVLGISVGATMGVDYALLDQLTIGVGVGATLDTTNAFDEVSFNLFTSDINATFWW